MIKIALLTAVISSGGGLGGFQIAYMNPEIAPINTLNRQYGLPSFGNLLALGGGGYAIAGKILFGGFGFGGSESVENDSMRVEYSKGAGYFTAGLQLVHRKFFYLFPTISFGGYSETITISPQNSDISWNSLYQNTARMSIVKRSGISLSPGLSILLFSNGLPLGLMLNAGYTLRTGRKWNFEDGSKLLNAPSFKKFVPVISMTLLSGGISR